MPEPFTLRVIVREPVPGVRLRVQRGRDALLAPVADTVDAVTFELEVEGEVRADGRVVCRGAAVQGPPAARFVYVNAGTYAGQLGAPYGRRAKVPLGGLRGADVDAVRRRPGTVLAGAIAGRGRDGGPAAASVPLLGAGWEVVPA